MDNKLYIVRGTGSNSDYFIGLATGTVEDITAYYDDKKGYGLRIDQANITNVPDGYAVKRDALIAEKRQLEKRIQTIEAMIKHPDSFNVQPKLG